jgi:HSP20 family protein
MEDKDKYIDKEGKESESQGQTQGRQDSPSSRSMQKRREQDLEWRPASVFSLAPREFFSASPFELMRRFTADLDRFFEGNSSGWGSSVRLWSPPIEISEKDGQLTVCAELPGLNKDDVKVEWTQDGLTISGERRSEQEDRREGIYRSERSYGSFKRTIPIPDEADVEHAKATFENGLLTVSVPVPETVEHRREIPIQSGSEQSQESSRAA